MKSSKTLGYIGQQPVTLHLLLLSSLNKSIFTREEICPGKGREISNITTYVVDLVQGDLLLSTFQIKFHFYF